MHASRGEGPHTVSGRGLFAAGGASAPARPTSASRHSIASGACWLPFRVTCAQYLLNVHPMVASPVASLDVARRRPFSQNQHARATAANSSARTAGPHRPPRSCSLCARPRFSVGRPPRLCTWHDDATGASATATCFGPFKWRSCRRGGSHARRHDGVLILL